MKVATLSILSVLAFLADSHSIPTLCPSAEDLEPCNCKRLAYGLHVMCADLKDNSDLIKAFKVLQDYEVENLLLHGLYPSEALPKDLFNGLKVRELRIEKSNPKFFQPALGGLDEILYALTIHSGIKSSEDFSLPRLAKLGELIISSNYITKVSNNWLNGKIPNVNNVNLDENKISVVESNAFRNLSHLKSISMADNKIKEVARTMFPRPANALTKIDLSGNEIKSLPSDFFLDVPNLKEVILSGNDLQTLSEETWSPVWQQLISVMLLENNLVCDESLDWIRKRKWPIHVVANCVSPSNLEGKSLQEVYKA